MEKEKLPKWLPRPLTFELGILSHSVCRFWEELSEITVREDGRSSVRVGEKVIPLAFVPAPGETERILHFAARGSMYLYRENLRRGYFPAGGGIRVGVCASGKSAGDGESHAGAVRAVSIRLPVPARGKSGLLPAFSLARRGMLLFSPPGGGKTTALRTLVREISEAPGGRHVCVIDEREEFIPEEYRDCFTDIFFGRSKRAGMESALRTMRPDVIAVDEIGEGEGSAVRAAMGAGVLLLATAHAAVAEDLLCRPGVASLLSCGGFDVCVRLGTPRSGVGHTVYTYRAAERTFSEYRCACSV